MGDITLDSKLFSSHITALRDALEANPVANVLAICSGGPPDTSYTKTQAFQTWLFGYEMADTLIAITSRVALVFTSVSKSKLFEAMKPNLSFPLEILKKDRKRPELDVQAFETILKATTSNRANVKLGSVVEEKQTGDFAAAWDSFVGKQSVEVVSVSEFLGDLFAVKDASELKFLRTSVSITSTILKNFLVKKIEDIIDKEREVTHNKIATLCEEFFQDAKKISSKLDASVVDSCYLPIIQSGGKYNLARFADNYPDTLSFGTIVVSLGGRYKQYCSDIARTYFVNPTKEQEESYEVLLSAFDALVAAMKPGVTLSSLYNVAYDVIKAKNPILLPHFLEDCGASIGIEFSDKYYTISKGCHKVLKKGMTFDVRMGLYKLPKENDEVYSILLSDTILVEDAAEVLTSKCTKKFNDISYELDNDPQPVKKKAVPKLEIAETHGFSLRKKEVLHGLEVGGRTVRKTAAREMMHTSQSTEAKRADHQKQLEEEMIRQAKRALKQKKKGGANTEKEEKKRKFISYSGPHEFPTEAQRDKVPFHISTIKTVTKNEDNLRINFKLPDGQQAGDQKDFMDPKATFVKEMTFRITNQNDLNLHLRRILELKKRVQQRETEMHQKMSLKTQPALVQSKQGRIPRLAHLNIRPNISGNRQTTGVLEAHTNGLRFVSKLGNVDIIYSNIKHCFFQPADNTLIIVLHFHLHNDIMVGKRKIKDIQFYTEVMEASQAVGGNNRRQSRWGDAEEIEDEQRERELKNRLNQEFKAFVKKLEELPDANLEFDMPYKELGFWGVPGCNNILLQPTVHCLINVIEYPPFVMTLDEVQIAYFERVQFSLQTFDLAFIFKDWEQKEVHINAIPSTSLESIKDWLDSCNIKYYQGKTNVNWKQALARIKVDPQKFWDEGGWAVLDQEENGDDEGSGDSVPDEYNPSSSDEDDYAVREDSSDSSAADGDDSGGYSDDGSDDDSGEEEDAGLDWDQLETRAEKDDRKSAQKRKQSGDDYDSDEEGQRRRASARGSRGGRGAVRPGMSRGSPTARGRVGTPSSSQKGTLDIRSQSSGTTRPPAAKRGRM